MELIISKAKQNKVTAKELKQKLCAVQKENQMLRQMQQVHLDDNQMNAILDSLERLGQSTDHAATPAAQPVVLISRKKKRKDMLSTVLRWVMGLSFIFFAIVLVVTLCINWKTYWNQSAISRNALFVIAPFVPFFLCAGIDILRERDRNYLLSLLSALVALAALIVALVK